MSTIVPRYIIVDDVDSRINYIGPWFPDQGSRDSAGIYGPPYRSTMHGTKANASLSFSFSGTHAKVYGSNNIRNDSGVLDPTWECFIDNIGIGASDPFLDAANNWVFCEQSTLPDGPHILTINATVMKSQTFWFDNIQYIPSANTSLDQAAIIVDSLDPQLQYGQGWQAIGGTANITVTPGTIFNYNFTGVSLSWYGFIPRELPITPSPATYSIDGQTPINFQLNGLPSNETPTVFNQQFFETTQLTAGPHTLEVVYQGNNSTPLVLEYLVVQNGTLSSTATFISSHATSTSTGNDVSGASTPGTSSPVGAIAGGVIGGLVLIVLFTFMFIILRRLRKHAAQEQVSTSISKPFDYTPSHPSSTTPNPSLLSGTSYSQAPQTMQTGLSAVTHGTKEHAYHGSMPSFTRAEISQSIEPPSTSSSVTTHPINLRPIPLQQAALTLANQSSPSVLVPVSSTLSPPILPTNTGREAEALDSLRTQRRDNPLSVSSPLLSNGAWSPDIVLHADSGIRMPRSTASAMDVPPIYTPD